MSTDSESRSIAGKNSHNSATYSIHPLEDVPIRKSVVQIIRERSSEHLQPRKKSTMQITKLVLKDHPTSPRRKVTPMVIKSITTFTSSALTGNEEHSRSGAFNDKGNQNGQLEEYTIKPLPNVDKLITGFEDKKREGNQASNEFQSFLLENLNVEKRANSGISKTTNEGKEESVESNSNSVDQPASITPPSKSESKSKQNLLESNNTVTSEKATKKMPPPAETEKVRRSTPRPKSVSSKKTPPEEPKKEKSYDPQKAREFIEKQQAKRKQEKKSNVPQTAEKDIIKKRLEELRKSSRILLNKNVQKVRKRSVSAAPSSSVGDTGSKQPTCSVVKEPVKILPKKPLRKSSSTSSLHLPGASAVSSAPSKNSSSISGSSKNVVRKRSSLLLKADLSEKMGIMRKPDCVALGDVLNSPLQLRTPPVSRNDDRLSENRVHISVDDSVHEVTIDNIELQLKLDVPAVTLLTDLRQQQPAKFTHEKKENKIAPTWLKHTLLQPDPYPFIMAVRKKLEAIRSMNHDSAIQLEESIIPKEQQKVPSQTKQNNNINSRKCLDYLESLKTVPYVQKPPVEESRSDQHILTSICQQPLSESNTTSEISSIKSDFVLPLPPLSSTKIDLPGPSNVTAAKNKSSPISPLSIERISNLKITGDNLHHLERSINFHRGVNMPEADQLPDRLSFTERNVREDLHQSGISANTSEKQRNFLHDSAAKHERQSSEKMLEAFNRSLAQVIQVNQQLYSALQKPPVAVVTGDRIKIRDEMTQTTPVPSVPISVSTVNSNYIEDFERSDVQKTPTKETSGESSRTPTAGSDSTTTATAESSPSKTGSSDSHTSLETRSLNLSDSHHTNPPLPEEYLPSFEESLHRHSKQAAPTVPVQTTTGDSTSIETQISDETVDKQQSLRQGLNESKSLDSIAFKISESEEKQNGTAILDEVVDSKVEFLKVPSSSSSSAAEAAPNDTTMGSDILAMFNRTDLEISILSTTVSETNLSYSSIGMYEQLIQNEKSKSEQLATRARLKEKALLDRTKGQLAWLELQKQRYRERGGMTEQISAIKKKQRAILVRLERERVELNKFQKHSLESSIARNNTRSPITPESVTDKLNSFSSNSRTISLRKSGGSFSNQTETNTSPNVGSMLASLQQHHRKMTTLVSTSVVSNSPLQFPTAMRGMELEPNENLEDMLTRREQELQKRRQYVQALLQWHQKLDREEQEILDIERNLLLYNRAKTSQKSTPSAPGIEQRLVLGRIRSIEQSLQTLQQIGNQGDSEDEQVQAAGSKLNRLWYRLTGFKENQYEPGRSYTLTRASLEALYEQAKERVLERFSNDREMRKILLEQSFGGIDSSESATTNDSKVFLEKHSNQTSNYLGEEPEIGAETSGGSSSFKTTINSVTEIEPADSKSSEEKLEEQIEEKSDLLDVDDIISRVSDITENINGILSSTTNIDELLRNEQEKHGSSSVEFHTIEEEHDVGKRDKSSPDGYSSTFDAPTIEEQEHMPPAEESQMLIEDTSLPQFCASIRDESVEQSETDSTNKVTEDIQDEASLGEASSTTSAASTFTTSEDPGEPAQYKEENGQPKSPLAVELEKRLITLHVDLEDFSDSLERVSAMRSPEAAKQSSSESERGNSFVERDDYFTDKESASETAEKPFPDESQAMRSAQKAPAAEAAAAAVDTHRMDVKIRNKNVNENFPHSASSGAGSSMGGTSILSYLSQQSLHNSNSQSLPVATASSIVPNRMPDIINEAEVLRRQQLQIEQEIKQLEQQVVLFREIPNKPPPPYIPPANGSPLALIFPSEPRIDELIESRTQDLFQSETPQEKLRSDHVTNIYEKLILDMCKELYADLRPPSPDVSFRTVEHDKRPLAFYNPPNSLLCMQDHMKRKVKRILNEESLLQHQQQQQNLHHCPMPFLMFNGGNGAVGGIGGGSAKRKRDQVDEILAQEMFDEESRWTNFDREEIEVKERIVGELTKMLVAEAVRDMEAAWLEKFDPPAAQTARVEEKPMQRTEMDVDDL
ncbi:uncharacterized protein LOC129729694 [Wyeomyia smithii]|uniref:uncharacterized protein LOC129729694 n=1 Tax=Wyeomyia smithii TaxID=174621 RepID=UPI002467B876|nr:uncharacterized protein LOC129729694 [Wyeomyia smithii]